DISAALETHRKSGAIATMILKENVLRERFTIVETENNLITGFGNFPEPLHSTLPAQSATPLMFTGIHILEPRVFDYIPRGVYSDIVPTFYNPAIADGERIAAHVSGGNWFELSTIPRYLDISLAMMNGANVCKGDNCAIAPDAAVSNSVLWNDVTIESGAKLHRTIIADGVTVRADERFENAAIVRAEMLAHCDEIPEKALKGERVGENYIVPLDV
ncbi:MAG: NDP-sugar synthase, partial [Acidobacteriota bacterium]|nr:NDP-sugar synthase [Acidobacteriota bacterium]